MWISVLDGVDLIRFYGLSLVDNFIVILKLE